MKPVAGADHTLPQAPLALPSLSAESQPGTRCVAVVLRLVTTGVVRQCGSFGAEVTRTFNHLFRVQLWHR